MKIFEVSEIFLSLEGEAQYTNQPTVYSRFARCNFTCGGFNNPTKVFDEKGYAPLKFIPINIKKLADVPTIDCGCDSQYAVNVKFAHIWEKLSAEQILDRVLDLLPGKSWQHPVTGLDVIYSMTGGEPLLQWKFLHELMFHPKMDNCKHVIFETNGAVPAKQEFFDQVSQWVNAVPGRKWTWSVSPKLSASGEPWEKAIRPDVVGMMRSALGTELYLKFVADPVDEQFAEIERARLEFGGKDIVWVMPMACTAEQQQLTDRAIASRCISDGYCFSYRVQNALWGNGVGT